MFNGVEFHARNDLSARGVRLVDLNGDGISDVIVAVKAASAVSREWPRLRSRVSGCQTRHCQTRHCQTRRRGARHRSQRACAMAALRCGRGQCD